MTPRRRGDRPTGCFSTRHRRVGRHRCQLRMSPPLPTCSPARIASAATPRGGSDVTADVAAVTRRVDRLTLVNGRSFVVAEHDGSLVHDGDGLVVEDMRVLSEFGVEFADGDGTIDREYLGVSTPSPFHAAVVSRPRPGDGSSDVPTEFYIHQQWVGHGVRHDVEIHNTAREPIERTLRLRFDADFAHLFEVKAGNDETVRQRWSGTKGPRRPGTSRRIRRPLQRRDPHPPIAGRRRRRQHTLTWG